MLTMGNLLLRQAKAVGTLAAQTLEADDWCVSGISKS